MNRIERLRQMKKKAVDRMEAIHATATAAKRDLTETEKTEYEQLRAEAEDLSLTIADLEKLGSPAPMPAPAANQKDEATLKAEGRQEERLRAKTIEDLVATAKLGADFAKQLVESGASIDQAREKILNKMREDQGKQPETTAHVAAGADARDKGRAAMTEALLHRISPRQHQLKGANEYAGFTLLDFARESLSLAGVKVRGMNRDEIARAALFGRNGAEQYFAGLSGTSDFPAITADVANKRLRMAYEAAPRTFVPFCRQATSPDFKTVNPVQLSDVSSFQKVNENGEFKTFTASDGKESYRLATYGGIFRMTRQLVINDDLRAFDRITQGIGTSAARLENETVWAVITANRAMADTVALFHANHSNLNSGGTSVLDLDGLSAARTALRKQTAPKGQKLNLSARYILLPAALETAFDQLYNSLQLLAAPAPTDIVPPDLVRNLTKIVEPILDDSSATAWYLAADPATIDTIEYCYLEGQEGVYVETRNGFEVDGVEIKGRLDFAAAAIDYRGLQKNAGA